MELRIPIAVKMITVTTFIVAATVAAVGFVNSKQIENTVRTNQLNASRELADSKKLEIDGLFMKYLEKVRMVTDLLLQDFADEDQRKRALDLAFGRDLDLVNIEIYQLKDGKPKLYKRETNTAYLRSFDLEPTFIDRLRREKPFAITELFSDRDRVRIANSTLPKGIPLLSMGVAFPDENGLVRHVVVADIRLDRLQKNFSVEGSSTYYLVDSKGAVLAHSDERETLEARDLSDVPIVQEAISQKVNRGQKPEFWDSDRREWFLGSYARTDFGPSVIVEAPVKILLEPARYMRRTTTTYALYGVWIALFFVFIFSYTLTGPIEQLHEVTQQIARGNFNVRADVGTQDEVADLAEGFNKMVEGLKERDKVKNLFNKFHGSSITEDLLKSNLNLGGSRKDVTVFFSDIRDFTKFSEGHTPEEVVEMLNEYFQIMVGIIAANGGIVDKFVGDAIMAVWGAPKSTGDDRGSALKASLEMRRELNALNERRIARGHTPVKIGIGIHSGPAISGTIGSTERMEYTVIGDTVNMASRIEASTKAFGADLLVSETVCQGMEKRFIFELAGAAEVKGKSEPIKMYKVRGTVTASGTQEILRTPYSDYEPGHVEKVKVA